MHHHYHFEEDSSHASHSSHGLCYHASSIMIISSYAFYIMKMLLLVSTCRTIFDLVCDDDYDVDDDKLYFLFSLCCHASSF